MSVTVSHLVLIGQRSSRVLQSGLAGWLTPLLYYFRGDYAPSIGHAPRPLHLMYREREEESDGERGRVRSRKRGWDGRRGRGVLPTVSLGGFSQVVLVSGAHVCESVNRGCHKVTAKSRLAYLLFFKCQ